MHSAALAVLQNRRDPTQTTSIRKAYAVEMRRRFRRVAGLIRTSVDKNDALALRSSRAPRVMAEPLGPHQFQFETDPAKVAAFEAWLAETVEQEILGTGELISVTRFDLTPEQARWMDKYIRAAYERGAISALQVLQATAILSPQLLDQLFPGGELANVLQHPFHGARLQMLFSRNFTQLKGVTDVMSQQISEVLTRGMLANWNPRRIANEMARVVDNMSRKRALLIARTEIIRANNEAKLNTFEQFNVERVRVLAEFHTVGDDRVCAICARLEADNPYTIAAARGLIPAHPACRCSWFPIPVEQAQESARQLLSLRPPGWGREAIPS